MEKSLTIVIPTYNRAQKLRRFLSYLLKIETHQSKVISLLEFIIADGSDEKDYKNSQIIAQLIKLGNNITYFHFPGVGLQNRFVIISEEIKTTHVLVCGDDDLVDFGGVRGWLENNEQLPDDYVYAGRFSNIMGISVFGLEVSGLERPYYGFNIGAEDVKTRVLTYGLANAFGITSLSYAIQPTFLFCEFWDLTKDRTFYYGGLELLHQTYLTARSKIFLSEKTLIFRDFTYIGYNYEKLREAPTTDRYPYFGEEAIQLAAQIVSTYSSIDASAALDVIENIIDIQTSILPSRLQLQAAYANQGKTLCSRSDSITVAAVRSVWFRAYLGAYPRNLAMKRFVILSLPDRMRKCLRKLVQFLQNP